MYNYKGETDYSWMKSFKPNRNVEFKPELPYLDESFRLFVNLKRDLRSEATQRKLIMMVAPNMSIG